MSPDEFRVCLDTIGWTQRGLAKRLGIHHTRTERMATGQYPVPANIGTWLELLATWHAGHALPRGWRPVGGV